MPQCLPEAHPNIRRRLPSDAAFSRSTACIESKAEFARKARGACSSPKGRHHVRVYEPTPEATTCEVFPLAEFFLWLARRTPAGRALLIFVRSALTATGESFTSADK